MLVILSAIITLIATIYNVLIVIRSIWNVIFGPILLCWQVGWQSVIVNKFGFLRHWFLRSLFFMFVGTNIMHCESDHWAEGECLLSICIGFVCIFVGGVELIFGFCYSKDEEGDADGAVKAGKGKDKAGANASNEGVTINITPQQAAAGASWASKNVTADQAKAGAQFAAQQSGGGSGGSDNPFFGNQHLGK